MVVALMSQAAAYIGARALPSMLFETGMLVRALHAATHCCALTSAAPCRQTTTPRSGSLG